MATLLHSPPSPYSAKARMAVRYSGYPATLTLTDTGAEPADLIGSNPLGKIPVLILDDGRSVFDSAAIMQFLNRETKNTLYPRNAVKRTEAEVLESLADGICDCLLAIVYERRFRPEELHHKPWLDKQWAKVVRALDYLEDNTPRITSKLTGGQIALAACLGYLSLRFEGQWERGRPKLKRWKKRFEQKFPDLVPLMPASA